jgi:hypothetical protein
MEHLALFNVVYIKSRHEVYGAICKLCEVKLDFFSMLLFKI